MNGRAESGLPQGDVDLRLLETPLIGAAWSRLGEGPVLVAGVGTLGSRVARSLAALGVPLLLADPGRVEAVNVGLQLYASSDVGLPKTEALRRQLLSIRGDLPIDCFPGDVGLLGPRALAGCRLWIGCLDRFRERLGLCEMSAHLGIPYLDLAIDGTGRSIAGRACGFDPGRGAACLACSWDGPSWEEARRESAGAGCAALAGAQPSAPPTLALPGLAEAIAGLGAVLASRVLLDRERDRVIGREWRLDLSSGRLEVVGLKPSPRCLLSHRRWRTRLLDARPEDLTLGGLFAAAGGALGRDVQLSPHGRPLVLAGGCPACRHSVQVASLRGALPACPRCGGGLVPLVVRLRVAFREGEVKAHLHTTWRDLGLPAGGAVHASSREGGDLVFLFAR